MGPSSVWFHSSSSALLSWQENTSQGRQIPLPEGSLANKVRNGIGNLIGMVFCQTLGDTTTAQKRRRNRRELFYPGVGLWEVQLCRMTFNLKVSFDLYTSICLTTSQTLGTSFLTPAAMDHSHRSTCMEINPNQTKTFFQLTIKKGGFMNKHVVCFSNKTPAQPTSIHHYVLSSFMINS